MDRHSKPRSATGRARGGVRRGARGAGHAPSAAARSSRLVAARRRPSVTRRLADAPRASIRHGDSGTPFIPHKISWRHCSPLALWEGRCHCARMVGACGTGTVWPCFPFSIFLTAPQQPEACVSDTRAGCSQGPAANTRARKTATAHGRPLRPGWAWHLARKCGGRPCRGRGAPRGARPAGPASCRGQEAGVQGQRGGSCAGLGGCGHCGCVAAPRDPFTERMGDDSRGAAVSWRKAEEDVSRHRGRRRRRGRAAAGGGRRAARSSALSPTARHTCFLHGHPGEPGTVAGSGTRAAGPCEPGV